MYNVGDRVIHYCFDIIFPKEYQPPGVSTEMSCVEALTICVTEKRKMCPIDVQKYFIALNKLELHVIVLLKFVSMLTSKSLKGKVVSRSNLLSRLI